MATVVDRVVDSRQEELERRGLAGHAALTPAPLAGDPRLIECLVVNLVDNAMRYNPDHGRIDILTATKDGTAVLSVSNTGSVVSASAVDRLLQPFQRIGRERPGTGWSRPRPPSSKP